SGMDCPSQRMNHYRWAIITGEFPPDIGGVSAYTDQVARELVRAGDEVHVWAPVAAQEGDPVPNVKIHRLPDAFGLRGLAQLDFALHRLPRPFRLLVQYVPQAFGWKAMNLPFCWWVSRCTPPAWIIFHEVAVHLSLKQSVKHNVLGLVQRSMAQLTSR